MKNRLALRAFLILPLAVAASAATVQQEKTSTPGPLTGTWECMSHGGSRGDTKFTLDLQQEGEKITGSVASEEGGMDITSATFKDGTLEIHLDTPDGNYVISAKLKDGQLTGKVTVDGKDDSTWEGKKATAAAK
jgi:hypothetical protein